VRPAAAPARRVVHARAVRGGRTANGSKGAMEGARGSWPLEGAKKEGSTRRAPRCAGPRHARGTARLSVRLLHAKKSAMLDLHLLLPCLPAAGPRARPRRPLSKGQGRPAG